MNDKSTSESKGIKISIIGAFIFTVLGLVFALWTGSQAVLLDGAFNLISAIMAIFALKISNLLKRPYSERFPAGFVALEPFYILIKGLILFILTAFVVTSNVIIMLSGGNELQLGLIVIYIGVAVAGNFIIYRMISYQGRKNSSPVLQIEKENWLVNALISSGIGISFLLVLLFQDGFLKPVVQYVDQIVVILVGLVTLPVPINAIRGGLRELLLISPEGEINDTLKNIVGYHMSNTLFEQWRLYTLKTGRKYWLTVIAIPSSSTVRSSLTDELQRQMGVDISKEIPDYKLDIIITKEASNL
jgi:predicted Co/Zn/Cd cation transporter (cation efflux family)